MNYIIIDLLSYFNTFLPSQNSGEQINISELHCSEIRNIFFEKLKKSPYKNLALGLSSGLLSLGVTRLLGRKYPIIKKHTIPIVSSFSFLPLSIQAGAYYYFGKHPKIHSLKPSFLFSQIYQEVLQKRREKSETRICLRELPRAVLPQQNKKIEDNTKDTEKEFVNILESLTEADFTTNTDAITKIINILFSVLEEETIFKRYAELLKNKNKDFNNELFKKIVINKAKGLLSDLFFFYLKPESEYQADEKDYYAKQVKSQYFKNSYNKFVFEKNSKLYKLELPPVPDEGIAGQEEKIIKEEENNEEKNNEEATPKTDDYFTFNIQKLNFDQYFKTNLEIIIFYLVEINEEHRLEKFAVKVIDKTKKLMSNIQQKTIQEYINTLLLQDMLTLFNRYRQAHKEEKLIKFFTFPFVKDIEKDKALQLINEFIVKNLRKNISDRVKKNTLTFIKNNDISREELKSNFLKNKNEHERKAYESLLNKNFKWLFEGEKAL